MKNVKKMVVLGLMLLPVVTAAGCGKRCGHSEPAMHHKLEKMKKEYGGK